MTDAETKSERSKPVEPPPVVAAKPAYDPVRRGGIRIVPFLLTLAAFRICWKEPGWYSPGLPDSICN